MILGTAAAAISIALPILKLSHDSIEKVNQKCSEKGLPPAFEIQLPSEEGKRFRAIQQTNKMVHSNMSKEFNSVKLYHFTAS